jgi:hypothetical protein
MISSNISRLLLVFFWFNVSEGDGDVPAGCREDVTHGRGEDKARNGRPLEPDGIRLRHVGERKGQPDGFPHRTQTKVEVTLLYSSNIIYNMAALHKLEVVSSYIVNHHVTLITFP